MPSYREGLRTLTAVALLTLFLLDNVGVTQAKVFIDPIVTFINPLAKYFPYILKTHVINYLLESKIQSASTRV